jgi:cation transport regulator ChaB
MRRKEQADRRLKDILGPDPSKQKLYSDSFISKFSQINSAHNRRDNQPRRTKMHHFV